MTKIKVLCVIGKSGSGKDTIAKMLSSSKAFKIVISHTTRPMREKEKQNVEHVFHDEEPKAIQRKIAYTIYGGYSYWITEDDLDERKINVYIIDEVGYEYLKENFSSILDIRILYIKRKNKKEISEERTIRDKDRKEISAEQIDYFINNNKGLSALMVESVKVGNKLIEWR